MGEFIAIIGGSLIIEQFFSIPGVGALYLTSINLVDYNFFMARKGSKYFTTNPGHFNNGNKLSWVVTVLECDANSATLQFRKY